MNLILGLSRVLFAMGHRRDIPRWVGLGACLCLAFWVAQQVWLVGIGLILAGLIWKTILSQLAAGSTED